jgi:hypothetical protein
MSSLKLKGTFEEVKANSVESGVLVRELNAKEYTRNLYLLMSKEQGDRKNGVIVEKETNKVVGECMDSLYENPSVKELNEILRPKGEDYVEDGLNRYEMEPMRFHMEVAEDGTLLRLYNYKGEWHTATSKCIDAEYSYWLSDKYSFDKMFNDVLGDEMEYEELDPNMTYNFILKHPLNRLVLKHSKASLVFVSKVNKETGEETLKLDREVKLNEKVEKLVVLPKVVESMYQVTESWADSIDSFEETRNVILETHTRENIDWTKEEIDKVLSGMHGYKGLMFVKYNFDTKRYTRVLYDTDWYRELKDIKGNTPNVEQRWLELYKDCDYMRLDKFELEYPEYKPKFRKLYDDVVCLVSMIYEVYLDTHVFRKYKIDDTDRLSKSVKRLHGVYMRSKTDLNKKGTSITYEIADNLVKSFDVKILMKLLGLESRPNKEKKYRILKRGESPPLPSID